MLCVIRTVEVMPVILYRSESGRVDENATAFVRCPETGSREGEAPEKAIQTHKFGTAPGGAAK